MKKGTIYMQYLFEVTYRHNVEYLDRDGDTVQRFWFLYRDEKKASRRAKQLLKAWTNCDAVEILNVEFIRAELAIKR